MEICYLFLILIGLIYSWLILSFTRNWFVLPQFSIPISPSKGQTTTKFSVLIPYRNEERNIIHIIEDLEAQYYDLAYFEVILIDDESTDKSTLLAREALELSKLNYQLLRSKGGKKKALKAGLLHASGEFVLTLDADVRIGNQHLNSFHYFYKKTNAHLIAGPVSFISQGGLFSRLLSLEFISLTTTSAASMRMGRPIMVNGANLGYKRNIGLEFQDLVFESRIPSGDDQFLMEAIENKYGNKSIVYLKSRDAIAKTAPPESLNAFINQRIRWASKAPSYQSKFSKWVAILVFLFSLSFIFSIGYSLYIKSLTPVLFLFILKFIVDLPILVSGAKFYHQTHLLIYYPITQLIHPWYVVVIAILSLFKKYTWKSRIVK